MEKNFYKYLNVSVGRKIFNEIGDTQMYIKLCGNKNTDVKIKPEEENCSMICQKLIFNETKGRIP